MTPAISDSCQYLTLNAGVWDVARNALEWASTPSSVPYEALSLIQEQP
jgi:hypothetical protein